MKSRILAGSAALLLIAGTIICVVGYNTWSVCGGRCTTASLLSFGPVGMLLLGLTLVAGFILLLLRRHSVRCSSSRCPCGAFLGRDWLFCPNCGLSRSLPSGSPP